MNGFECWEEYFEIISKYRRNDGFDSFFNNHGYFKGLLDKSDVKDLVNSVSVLNNVSFRVWDHVDNYEFNPLGLEGEDYVNSNFTYKCLSEEFKWRLGNVLNGLKYEIEQQIGGPFKVVATRVWEQHYILSESKSSYSLGWHTDDFPSGFYKVLIYMSPLSEEWGTVQLRLNGSDTTIVESEPGTWLLIKASDILHRGVAPMKEDSKRTTIEVTIHPALTENIRITDLGVNSQIPRYPWSQAKDIPLAKRRSYIYDCYEGFKMSGYRGIESIEKDLFGGSPQILINKIIKLSEVVSQKMPVIVYGYGSVAKVLLPLISSSVTFIVDKSESELYASEIGKKVLRPEEISAETYEKSTLLVTPIGRKEQIEKYIKDFNPSDIIFVEDFIC